MLVRKASTVKFRVVLSIGHIPRWVGAFLLGLDEMDAIALQVAQAELPAGEASLSAATDIPALAEWLPSAAEKQRLVEWQTAAEQACDVVLLLGAAAVPEKMDLSGAQVWTLVDGESRPLCARFPLLETICAGHGIHLELLQQDGGRRAWQACRYLHVASTSRYAQALQSLAENALRLVKQTIVDRRLGVLPVGSARQIVVGKNHLVSWVRTRGTLRHLWRRFLERLLSEYWRIGVIDAPIDALLKKDRLPEIKWLTFPRVAGYFADPFYVPGRPQDLFCEYFDERTGLGRLEKLQFDAGDRLLERTPLAVGEGRHVSFPHVFEVDGRRLGIAETVACRECVLHEVDAEGNWHPLFPLLSDVRTADPALCFRDGRWWLAFTDVDVGGMDNLCFYHAERLEGPWTPHANNPVKIDIAGARMAGAFFEHDGELYRPAQNCQGSYGASVVLHRVVQLTPERFEEVEVASLLPDRNGLCPDGLHTLNAWGTRTLVDGKRHAINPLVLWRNLSRRWQRSRGRSAVREAGTPESATRILVYVPHLRVGGGEISMLRLAEGLAADGLDVCLVANSADTAELPVPPGVRFVSLGAHGTLSSLWRLVGLLRESRPRWLLSAFPHTNIAAVAALALSGIDARCVVTEHAPLSRQIAQQDNWRYRILPGLVRWAYRRAHAVVGVSTGVRDDLQQMLGAGVRPHVIRNPVLTNAYEAEMAMETNDPWLADKSLRVVMSVCRLSVEKDLPTLVEAFAQVHRNHPETRLLLVGEGPDRARLQGMIGEMGLGDVVRLPGYTATPLSWMRHAAVFVLSSRYEGFGNALVEAMACGIPVVSTDCPVGPREILEDGRLGALVPVGDASAMARAIADALDRSGPFPGAREAALGHTQAKSCAHYRRLFESLCGGNGRVNFSG